ncbi:MAG TPA: rod shape-determining protein MreC [Steroidobacteraceae bacterium]|nr:rod shape-determining protein MreC [Steroidobacteraceae bacterium]
MAAYGAGNYRASQGRGPAPGFSFFLYALLAIVLMALDRRGGYLVQVRYYLSAAAYPLQLAVSSPAQAWHWTQDSLIARETLETQNAELLKQNRDLSMKLMRLDALTRENAELRGLRQTLPAVADHWMPAEVVDVELSNLRQRLLINRGAHNGVFRGQAVMDNYGLLGQTIRVGPWSSEVILISDPEHAVPVEIARTGVHTTATGTSDPDSLILPDLPANADVKPGDLLLTSGLGGVFPQGYPVARIAEVRHDAAQTAQFRATPLAHLNALHEVTLVWFDDTHPAAPTRLKDGSSTTGNPALQKQPSPPLELLPLPTLPRLTAGRPAGQDHQ